MTTTINFNATGSKRKELAAAISEITGKAKTYSGAPRFIYQVGFFTVDRSGNLVFEEAISGGEIKRLLTELAARGFEPVESWPEEASDETSEEPAETRKDESYENGGFTISVPEDSLDETGWHNLNSLIAAKQKLIMKALGCDTTNIVKENGVISFPWFRNSQPSVEVMNAATLLISALIKMAKNQKRTTVKEKEVSNEKYAFRCFLLRLGFIGEEYKQARSTLLKNFAGSAAFKAGQKNIWYKVAMVTHSSDAESGMCEPASYVEMVRAASEEDAIVKANAKAKREEANASCVNAEPASDEEYAVWKANIDAETKMNAATC